MAEEVTAKYRVARATPDPQVIVNRPKVGIVSTPYRRARGAPDPQLLVAEGTQHATRPPVPSVHAEHYRQNTSRPLRAWEGSQPIKHARMLDPDAMKVAQNFAERVSNCMDRFSIDAIASIRSSYLWLGGEHEQARWLADVVSQSGETKLRLGIHPTV